MAGFGMAGMVVMDNETVIAKIDFVFMMVVVVVALEVIVVIVVIVLVDAVVGVMVCWGLLWESSLW